MKLEAVRQEVIWKHLNSLLLWESLSGVKVVLLSYSSTSASCDTENTCLFEKKRCHEMFFKVWKGLVREADNAVCSCSVGSKLETLCVLVWWVFIEGW